VDAALYEQPALWSVFVTRPTLVLKPTRLMNALSSPVFENLLMTASSIMAGMVQILRHERPSVQMGNHITGDPFNK